jgi:hypothetical protein
MNYPTVITKDDSEKYSRSIQAKEWIPLPKYVLTTTTEPVDNAVSRIELRYLKYIERLKREKIRRDPIYRVSD